MREFWDHYFKTIAYVSAFITALVLFSFNLGGAIPYAVNTLLMYLFLKGDTYLGDIATIAAALMVLFNIAMVPVLWPSLSWLTLVDPTAWIVIFMAWVMARDTNNNKQDELVIKTPGRGV